MPHPGWWGGITFLRGQGYCRGSGASPIIQRLSHCWEVSRSPRSFPGDAAAGPRLAMGNGLSQLTDFGLVSVLERG